MVTNAWGRKILVKSFLVLFFTYSDDCKLNYPLSNSDGKKVHRYPQNECLSLISHIWTHTKDHGRNACPVSGQAQTCGLIKPVNDIPNLSIDNRVSNGNEDITKQWNKTAKICFHPRRTHSMPRTNDNMFMDSTHSRFSEWS